MHHIPLAHDQGNDSESGCALANHRQRHEYEEWHAQEKDRMSSFLGQDLSERGRVDDAVVSTRHGRVHVEIIVRVIVEVGQVIALSKHRCDWPTRQNRCIELACGRDRKRRLRGSVQCRIAEYSEEKVVGLPLCDCTFERPISHCLWLGTCSAARCDHWW